MEDVVAPVSTMKCPYCAEPINQTAKKCKHCGEILDPQMQEPGTSGEIAQFCKKNYGVTFPLADKSAVSGNDAIPFYRWAGSEAGFLGKPQWNFHKDLFDKEGHFVAWDASTTTPESSKIANALNAVLNQ